MRQWIPSRITPGNAAPSLLADLIGALALPGFAPSLLSRLRSVVPATSFSVYRTGPGCRPVRFMSASQHTPDTTRDCWRAYLSGPYLRDRTLMQRTEALEPGLPVVCHITAREVPAEHRVKVYDAHGMVERVSVVRREAGDSVFAINFYRHADEHPFSDSQLADFGEVAPAVLALTQKHLALCGISIQAAADDRLRLQALGLALTARELDVCERLLRGMTQDGIAADLGLGLPTIKTYRNRAFARLGIHFRNELFALLHASPQ